MQQHREIYYSGWHKDCYVKFSDAMTQLFDRYPCVQVEDVDLFFVALDIAKASGLDWVDCMLIAENKVYGHTVCSIDSEVEQRVQSISDADPLTGIHLV